MVLSLYFFCAAMTGETQKNRRAKDMHPIMILYFIMPFIYFGANEADERLPHRGVRLDPL